jgi:membrane dipeptidase
MLIVDMHLDLAMNAIEWNRDLTRPIEEIRAREQGMTDKPDRGHSTVCFPEMRRGGVGLSVATQIARYVPPGGTLTGWHSQEQAWAMTQAQLAWYRAMEERGELVQIRDLATLDAHVGTFEARREPRSANREPQTANREARGANRDQGKDSIDTSRQPPAASREPIGYILSLEGADSIVTLRHLERAYEYGLRALGPAHYGPGIYAQGTNATGGIGAKGRELLQEMERLGIILDATHLCDDSFREALNHFRGPVWASHSNCRALVPHNRQFSDDQLRELIARDAVIGSVFDAWMLVPEWKRGETTPESAGVTLNTVVDHIDHICQLAGNARHCCIGSDLDGAFGREQCPSDVSTIADLSRLPDVLARRGYARDDVAEILSGNFLRFLRNAWGG